MQPTPAPERRNPCAGNPCGHNGICQVIGDRASCSCKPDFVGRPPQCRPECISHGECSTNKACLDYKCKDPCPGVCGVNAFCKVVIHNPICGCSEGYTGDPFKRCHLIPPIASTPQPPTTPRPITVYTDPSTQRPIPEYKPTTSSPIVPAKGSKPTTQPPMVLTTQRDPVIVNPCDNNRCGVNAMCKVDYSDRAKCVCREGYFGDAYSFCRPECVLNSDCNAGYACINRECKDPCPGACSRNAVCTVVNHRAQCNCVHPYTGNAYIGGDCKIEPIVVTTRE